MAQISIIILTYNSSRFIEALLKSLISLKKDYEILVVDNDSSDETVKLAKKFEEVKVFETGVNLGFAKGINFGAKKASSKYLLFINPDTVFEDGNIEDMIELFKSKRSAGIVGGKLIDVDASPEKSAGRFFNLFETILLVLGLDEAFGVRFSPEKLSKVDFVSGGFMMIKKDLFEDLGGFDENYFMYVEDMDLCFRAKRIGFNTYFTPDTVVSHVSHGSSDRSFAVVNIYKGILYFYSKHKSKLEFEIVKFMLKLKARSIYLFGRLINNSYYTNTYKKALTEIKNI